MKICSSKISKGSTFFSLNLLGNTYCCVVLADKDFLKTVIMAKNVRSDIAELSILS